MNTPHKGYELPHDPRQGTLNKLIEDGQVEVIDPSILKLPGGIIEFRDGDQCSVVLDPQSGKYSRQWPSAEAYTREEARVFLREDK